MESQKEERKKRVESLFKEKKMARNFPNVGRDSDIQVYKVNRSPLKSNPQKYSPRPIIVTVKSSRHRILKARNPQQG